MPEPPQDRVELLQGTLDMLILRTLLFGPAHEIFICGAGFDYVTLHSVGASETEAG